MKNAVVFGAGNIGRGFIGAVLADAGYKIVYADVVESLLEQINKRGEYTLHICDFNKGEQVVKNVSAVNSNSEEAVEAISEADVVCTSVGLRVVKIVAPTIAKGLMLRKKKGIETLTNVICCENGLRVSSQLKAMIMEMINDEEKAWLEEHVGFPNAVVNRIVPPAVCEEPLDVMCEENLEWDVERALFKGDMSQIPGLTPVDNLDNDLERKLFTLNTGHAAAAYIGRLKGYDYIGQSMADEQVYSTVEGVMHQSGECLLRKFNLTREENEEYIQKIIRRFKNPYVNDPCVRVGREPLRKLAADDRLILPLKTAKEYGLPYDKLLLSVGAALHFNNPADKQSVELVESIANDGLENTVEKYTGVKKDDPLFAEIIKAYSDAENLFAKKS